MNQIGEKLPYLPTRKISIGSSAWKKKLKHMDMEFYTFSVNMANALFKANFPITLSSQAKITSKFSKMDQHTWEH